MKQVIILCMVCFLSACGTGPHESKEQPTNKSAQPDNNKQNPPQQRAAPTAKLSFSKKGTCERDSEIIEKKKAEKIQFKVDGDKVTITQFIAKNCCSEIKMKVESANNTVKIVQNLTYGKEGACLCKCGSNVELSLSAIPSTSKSVEIWFANEKATSPAKIFSVALQQK